MQYSVFECSICFNYYDKEVHRPLILPCGHVYCFDCLNKMFNAGIFFRKSDLKGNNFCPADKTEHKITIPELSVCFAILNHLPETIPKSFVEPSGKPLHCKRHPNKTVKFLCEPHHEFLCSHCVLDHTGEGHKVNSFAIDLKSEKEKANELKSKIINVNKTLNRQLEKHDKKLASMDEHLSKQQMKLEHDYNKALKTAAQKQQELTKAFSENKQNCGFLSNYLETSSEIMQNSAKISEDLKTCLTQFSSIEELSMFLAKTEKFLSELISQYQEAKIKKEKLTNSRFPLKILTINDQSELLPVIKRPRNMDPNIKQENFGRAHSTARDHRKHSKKHEKKHKNKVGDVSHRIDENFELVGMNKIHRNETVSPVRDKEIVDNFATTRNSK